MNLPNRLTLVRILTIPLFFFAAFLQAPYGKYVLVALFLAGAGTDAVDGYLARKQGQRTRFGELFDPLADKLLVSAALVLLVEMQRIPGWVAAVIISRELAVTVMRSFLAAGGSVSRAGFWGKVKTVLQVVAIGFLFLQEKPYRVGELTPGNLFLTVALILTVCSGLGYFHRWWAQLKEGGY
ncbi:MAG: CDP-diacylglycerol--glycerol-3-phosphate 3-phosphatidyltransferase [Desulfotomaculales bacterium]